MRKIAVLFLLFLFTVPSAYCDDIILSRDIKPGMKGFGLTVFQGTEPERFEVEVIDVLKRAMPKQDLILIKCSGHNLEKTRVIAGMSGSPVYIEGKLAGAVAYAWTFSQEPIAGVTPIENMLAELDRPDKRTGWMPETPGGNSGSSRFQYCKSPVILSGFTSGAADYFQEHFSRFNLVPVQAGGVEEAGGQEITVKPGAVIGVPLVRGDWNATVIGTITYVDKDRILAFGHPFFEGGRLEMPITTGKVHTVLSSAELSFKFASPVREVGVLLQDHMSCTSGRTGQTAKMIPLQISVENLQDKTSEKYKVEIANNQYFTPNLLQASVMNALLASQPSSEDTMLDFQLAIQLNKNRSLKVSDKFFLMSGVVSPMSTMSVLINGLISPLGALWTNSFEDVKIESVDVKMSVLPKRSVARITALNFESSELEPGVKAKLLVTLQPFNLQETVIPVEFDVPDEMAGKILTFNVGGGDQFGPDAAPPASLDDLIRIIESLYRATDLVVEYKTPAAGVKYRGENLKRLPMSAVAVFNAQNATGTQSAPDLIRVKNETRWVIYGPGQSISIRVKEKIGGDK